MELLPGQLASPSSSADADVALAMQGDVEAVTRIYREHQVALRSFAQRVLGERQAAEDLVQDVFVALPSVLANYRVEAKLSTFLIGVAANRCRNHLRGAQRRRAAMGELSALPPPEVDTPQHELERRERARRLSAALDRLPLKLRVAFVLVAVEQRSHAEAPRR